MGIKTFQQRRPSKFSNAKPLVPQDMVLWTDSAGDDHAVPATSALTGRGLHLAQQARRGHQYPQRKNYEGLYWFAGMQQHVWHESLFESTALMHWDFIQDIETIASQPMRIIFESGHEHYPDFFALHQSGDQVLYDVRPERLIDESARFQFAETARVCAKIGWRYEVFSHIEATSKTNMEWLANYRHQRNEPTIEDRERVLNFLAEPKTLAATAKLFDFQYRVRGLPFIYHLMWTGLITFDMQQPLMESTNVWRKKQ